MGCMTEETEPRFEATPQNREAEDIEFGGHPTASPSRPEDDPQSSSEVVSPK